MDPYISRPPQLPPVRPRGCMTYDFAFMCEAWAALDLKVVMLTRIFRQTSSASDDDDDAQQRRSSFIQILHEIRLGKISTQTCQILRGRVLSTSSSSSKVARDGNNNTKNNIDAHPLSVAAAAAAPTRICSRNATVVS